MTTPSDGPAGHPADGPVGAEAAVLEAEAETRDAERAVFFSDAVVAIAITLLALELPVPAGTSTMTNSQLLHELWGNSSAYFACLISFFVISNHWMVHRATFRYIRRMSSSVNMLNLCWLLMMVLTPLAARLLGGDGAFGVRFGFYALVQVISVASLVQIRSLLSRQNLLAGDAPEPARKVDNRFGLVIIALFLVSIPVGFVTEWAYLCWAAIPVVTHSVRRLAPAAALEANVTDLATLAAG